MYHTPMRRGAFAPILLLTVVGLCLHRADPASAQGFPPDQAAARMTGGKEFQVDVAAAEPLVRQPVCIEFDDRGRLWAVQYLQYPNPAGLKRASVDRYSRTKYDRVPDPPPHGPRGADRITILTDTDHDGRADHAKDFIDGLNLASGVAFGHGGVFVIQVPYLLFYPDKNRDDVPDGDPEVLLSGFGMEDAHSVANSLTWGPDGWLYGCQGSTVTSNIRGIEFQQGVWRYHPLTKKFELFCEGGGNSWGLDFDAHGNLIYSTNLSPYRMLHGVQGAYYWKFFGKHGALHNPYAYGYFDHIPYANFEGGHVTTGGMIYQGDSFPETYRGKYVAGDLLAHQVVWSDLFPDGSSFRAAQTEPLIVANDTWFAPSDLTIGPDGAVYVADWCDKRTAHPDPDADWDRSNGRVFRVQAKEAKDEKPMSWPLPNFADMKTYALIGMLPSKNEWIVRMARRALADRRDASVVTPLRSLVLHNSDDHVALECLWGLYVSGGFDETFAFAALEHQSPDIRRWTIRFIGDEQKASEPMAQRLAGLAAREGDVGVRSQLASTAKRVPAEQGLRIVRALLARDQDAKDPHVPLLLWWAVEPHAIEQRDQIVEMFTGPDMIKSALARSVVMSRLMRRWSAQADEPSLVACARLLHAVGDTDAKRQLIAGFNTGAGERAAGRTLIVRGLLDEITSLWSDQCVDPQVIRALVRMDFDPARRRVSALALDAKAPLDLRVAMIELLGVCGDDATLPKLLDKGQRNEVQIAAVTAPRLSDDVASQVVARFAQLPPPVRQRAADVLLSRKDAARALLESVDAGRVPAAMLSVEQVRKVELHHDSQIDALVRKHWGNLKAATPEAKLADARRLNNDLRAFDNGDRTSGHAIFAKTCATCHRLNGEGNDIGPDLTHANRGDRDYLLVSIVDPSSVVRAEYVSYIIKTTDGQALTGLVAEQSAGSVTLKNANNQRVTVERAKIKEISESPISLMPEGLITSMKPQEVRDLFAYLQGAKP
jgi:putative membrane-bound dehydrogenase-like protein